MSTPPEHASRTGGNPLPPALPPTPPQDHSADKEQRRVVDAEVLDDDSRGPDDQRNRHAGERGASYAHEKGEQGRAGGFFYGRSFGYSREGTSFAHILTSERVEQNACLAPCVTLALFMVCLAQFGFLAGLGFIFFHTLGSVAGFVRSVRLLAQGRPPSPWLWRLGNWILSFLLTVWLAGGLGQAPVFPH